MEAYIDELVENAVVLEGAADVDEELLRAERARDDFSFDRMSFLAKVVDLYDGDTVRVVFRCWGHLVQWKARMAGYDSPEMNPPKSSPTREAEKAAALAAKAALADKVRGRLVLIECGPFDKYGRVLVTVFLRGADGSKGENVNAWMISQGHGVPYGGGTKEAFMPR